MLDAATDWNVYTSVRATISNARISGTNNAAGLRGLVADYDMQSKLETVEGYLNQLALNFRPQFIETSLSEKVRLVWVFEKELLVNGNAACQRVIEAFFKEMGVSRLLPGYDPASTKPTELWTNGGEWRDFSPAPLAWPLIFGMAVEASKNEGTYAAEIDMDTIAEEVKARWPGRWQGLFEVNALGLRFWDNSADCESGCQVKPDGMLCFTGQKPFVSWAEIFGPKWVSEKRALHLSKAASGMYFDGRRYWQNQGENWVDLCREDVSLALRNSGLSSKPARSQSVSDVDKVLAYIQVANRVEGAAPLINRKPGLIILDRRRVINTYTIPAMEPAKESAGPEQDFPWLWHFLNGLFDNAEDRPVDYFLAWLQRFYRAQREYKRAMGQAVFLCGPAGNGKTLLSERIIKPMIGDQISNPYDYFTGRTPFNDDIFRAPLLAINDEEAPDDERERMKFLARIKSFVVNPSHTYHPKFLGRLRIEWTGRIFVTLNDDASSVGLLPEINDNTGDKLSFYGSRPYSGDWLESELLEATIARELPFFACWLLGAYKPPAEIMGLSRMGVHSYFDRRIARIGRQQHPSYNFLELIRKWVDQSPHWEDGTQKEWVGNPTDLHSAMLGTATTEAAARKWEAPRAYWALTTLDRLREPGIIRLSEAGRIFRLVKADLLKNQPKLEQQ